MTIPSYFKFLMRSKETHHKKSECFMCDCESPDHVVVFSYDDKFDINELKYMGNNESSLWLQTQFHQGYNFLDRVMLCIKYLLNPHSTTNQWNTTLIKEPDLLKLQEIIDKTVDIYCCKLLYENKYKNIKFIQDLEDPLRLIHICMKHITDDGDELSFGQHTDVSSSIKFAKVFIKSTNMAHYKTFDYKISDEQLQDNCISMFINNKYESLKERHKIKSNLDIKDISVKEDLEELDENS